MPSVKKVRKGTSRKSSIKKFILNIPKFKKGDKVVFTGVALERGNELKGQKGTIVGHWRSHFALRDVHFYNVRLRNGEVIRGVGEFMFGRRIIKKI